MSVITAATRTPRRRSPRTVAAESIAVLALVGQHLAQGHPRGVIDGHVSKLPPGPRHAVAAIAGDPVAGPPDASELFDIQVHQLAGARPFIAPRGRRQLQHVQPAPSAPAHDAGHGRPTDPDQARDLGTDPTLTPQDLDAQHRRRGGLWGR